MRGTIQHTFTARTAQDAGSARMLSVPSMSLCVRPRESATGSQSTPFDGNCLAWA